MITEKEILKTATLAKIEIAENEIDFYIKEIDNMLTFAEALSESKAEDPTQPVVDFRQLRADEVEVSLSNAEVLSNAPCKEDGFFSLRKKA